jgi:DNA-binding LytR/AlgR family response regulator
MKKIRTIIVEDLKRSRWQIKCHLHEFSDLDLLGEFQNTSSARKFLQQNPVDLLFIDIQMPDMAAIDLINDLPGMPVVVLTTALPEVSFGVELKAVDYLVKPVAQPRFETAVNRIRKYFSQESAEITYLPSGRKLYRLDAESIRYLEVTGNLVKIQMENQEIQINSNIRNLLSRLPVFFTRVNRQQLINLHHLETLDGLDVIVDGTRLKVSKDYRQELIRKMYLS